MNLEAIRLCVASDISVMQVDGSCIFSGSWPFCLFKGRRCYYFLCILVLGQSLDRFARLEVIILCDHFCCMPSVSFFYVF